MLGTIVNTGTIIVGALLGSLLHRGVKEKYREAVYTALGLVCLGIGLNATISNLSKSEFPVLFVIAMALGNIYGGRKADKDPDPGKLYGRILIAAIWIALIPLVGKYIILAISGILNVFLLNSKL